MGEGRGNEGEGEGEEGEGGGRGEIEDKGYGERWNRAKGVWLVWE